LKFDPISASNFDPFERDGLAVALVSAELAGIAETSRRQARTLRQAQTEFVAQSLAEIRKIDVARRISASRLVS